MFRNSHEVLRTTKKTQAGRDKGIDTSPYLIANNQNVRLCGGLFCLAISRLLFPALSPSLDFMSAAHRKSIFIYITFFLIVCVCPVLQAQQPAAQIPAVSTNSPAEQMAALQLQLTNAWQRVLAIVNQPVAAYRRTSDYRVSVYSPGWFHPGAETPDFNTVDVRQSQQLIYTNEWVSSDISPGMMFKGRDLEFNAMTKLFYTNRSLPKKRLTEAEMVEINSLYRVIGHCRSEINRQETPVATETAASDETESNTNDIAPGQAFAGIRRIPQQTRILYGGIAVGALIVLAVVSRLFRKKSD